jgi:glycosyltransferase involved in cell wall biosynthesis
VARVALICEPPDGGVAEHVAQLALGLGAHGHRPVVLAPAEFRPAERLHEAGVEHRPLALRRDYAHPHHDAAALGVLARELRRGGHDVAHGHAAKAGVLARLAAAPAGIPAVYTPHCLPFVGEVSAARRRFGTLTERALAPLTRRIVCVCEEERRVALAAGVGPAGRLTVIHNGCPPPAPGVEPDPAQAALRAEGPVVAAIAVLRRQKRLDVLLDAAPRILAAVPEARIAIVGDGPEREALHARAEALGLAREPRLAWLPFAAPSARHLAATDVYVLSSSWEAFPIGALEALASGVPQVATDVGGTAEAVTAGTGVLVPPRDPAALAGAVIALLRDPARRARMADASRARHAERFGIERMVARTAEVYDEVTAPVARGRRRAPAA